jgi:hypothetical protein
MGLLSFFRPRSLPIEWEYRANGVIWRLLPSGNGMFIGEDRGLERKEVTFFCLHRETGTPLWKNVTYSEKWWIGLEAVHGETIFLHEYSTPDMPEHKKIIAVDARSGKCRWINEQLTFIAADDRFVYGKKNLFEDDVVCELDVERGNLVREIDRSEIPKLHILTSPTHPQIEFPNRVGSDYAMPDTLKTVFQRLGLNEDNRTGVEYLEVNDVLVVSWYEEMEDDAGDKNLRQLLNVVGWKKSDIRYSDCIAERVSAVIPELFFRMGNRIHYIKEKKLLRSLNLQRVITRNDEN